MRLGAVYPLRVGTNFLNEGYQSNFGASAELSFPIYKNWFGQIAYSLFHARVNNPESVGFIDKTGVTHVHVALGYQWILSSKYEVDAKLGVGPAIYRHFQEDDGYYDDKFYDDGTSLTLGAGLLYRINTDLGIYAGLEYLRDFLNTQVNAQDRDFFRYTSIINPKLGVSVKF